MYRKQLFNKMFDWQSKTNSWVTRSVVSQGLNKDKMIHILYEPFQSVWQESCQMEFRKAGLTFQCQFQTISPQAAHQSRLFHSANRNYINIYIYIYIYIVHKMFLQHLPSQTTSVRSFRLHYSDCIEQTESLEQQMIT